MIKPPHLELGDRILVVSPSSQAAAFPRRLQRGLGALRTLGFAPILAPNALVRDDYRAGTPEQRAADIMKGFLNPDIRAIIATTGGYSTNSVLGLLDYDAIRSHPKIFMGFSDITAIHCALISCAGIIAFHGPTVLPSFGESGGVFPFTAECVRRAVCNCGPLGKMPDPGQYTEEWLWWEKDDTRPRILTQSNGPTCIVPGAAEGPVVGGNLDTLLRVIGTRFFPDLTGSILFLEEEGGSAAKTERDMQCLATHGVFDQVSGIIFARPYRYDATPKGRSLETILREVGQAFQLPVLGNVAAGHTDPKLTIPLGVKGYLDADRCEFSITEPATS